MSLCDATVGRGVLLLRGLCLAVSLGYLLFLSLGVCEALEEELRRLISGSREKKTHP